MRYRKSRVESLAEICRVIMRVAWCSRLVRNPSGREKLETLKEHLQLLQGLKLSELGEEPFLYGNVFLESTDLICRSTPALAPRFYGPLVVRR